jgi:hypothetical protein
MPVTLELIKQGRVALQTYSDPLTMAHIVAVQAQIRDDILPAAVGMVYFIADFRQVHRLPPDILTRGAVMLDHTSANTGTIVAVFSNAVLYRMARAFVKMVPRHSVIIANSIDEALTIIEDLLAKEDAPPAANGG